MNLRPGEVINFTAFKEEKTSFYVYWIFTEEMTNPYKEGYVGITDYVEKRMMQHLYDKNCTKFDDELRLMDLSTIRVKILHKFKERSDAKQVEKDYRPHRLGWNAKAGG